MGKEYKQIIPYKKDDCRWSDNLRAQIFNQFKNNFKEEDWCCRLDADEIYIDNPRLFLAKIPRHYDIVFAAMFTYYFTEKDFERYIHDPSSYSDTIPVDQKCLYYRNNFAEIRFFRYHKNLTWPNESECLIGSDCRDWPTGLRGNAYPVRIWIKNYRYRSPEQIQKRINIRLKHITRGLFPQEMQYQWKELSANIEGSNDFSSWKSKVADSSKLNYDSQDNRYIVREELMLSSDNILVKQNIKTSWKNAFKNS